MPIGIESIQERFNTLKAERQLLERQAEEKKTKLQELVRKEELLIKARWVITQVSQVTQQAFKERVESLVTLAIHSVFDRPYQFVMNFEQQRNKVVCVPMVKEGEIELIPKDEMGGGIIDVISFAFRVILWSLQNPRSRNVFILDEPMKWVGKGERLQRAGQMFHQLSHRLGFQLIIASHEPELAEIADRAFQVTHDGQSSTVTLIGGNEQEPSNQRRLTRRRA
jgi:DNA repair exonuclease SbcCD ATPase subunit